MKGKIKIRTMKDDLADAENKNLPEPEKEKKQDQSKTNTASMEMASSGAALPGMTLNKLKDNEVNELRNLIKKISKTTEKDASEEKQVDKKNVAAAQPEQINSKDDQKERVINNKTSELEDLIDKVSKTMDKEKETAIEIPAAEKEGAVKETEEDKQSFWSDISEKLKNDKLSETQKTNEIKKEDQPIKKSVAEIKDMIEDINKEAPREEYSDSGILIKKELPEIKEEGGEKKEDIRRGFHKDNYQSPENRLIFGKQERYSSVSKRIKLKEKKDADEIEDLRNIDETKEKQRIISENEKYRKLKNRVIRKYHIKLFSLPWKRIVLISIILIALAGATFYMSVKHLAPTPPEPSPVVTGTEIEDLAKIRNEIEIAKSDIIKIGFKENAINREFELNRGIKELRVIIKHDGNIIPVKDALASIKIRTEDFPEDFWKTTTGSYNVLALKTGENSFRFAIAVKSDDITSLLKTMRDWEQESVDKRKMFNVFEPIFINSKVEEGSDQLFKSASYNYVYLRYINLPDQQTGFDYFASGDMLVITASKENAFRMIDILSADNY